MRAARGGLLLALIWASSLGAFYEWGGPAARGVRELKKNDPRKAVGSLREGRADLPRSAAVRYDQALAYQGAGNPDSARTAYQDAARSEELQGDRARAAAAYNLGNQAMRAENYGAASRLYRESLRIDPTRSDAKRNLEEAIRRGRNAPPQQRSGGSDPTKKNSGGKDPSQGQKQGDSGPQQNTDQKETQPSGGQPPQQLGTAIPSKAEAEHWLDALESERQAARKRDRGGPEDERGQRDW